MHQYDLDRAVAQASGESIATVAQHGFVLLTTPPRERESGSSEYEDLLIQLDTSDPTRVGISDVSVSELESSSSLRMQAET